MTFTLIIIIASLILASIVFQLLSFLDDGQVESSGWTGLYNFLNVATLLAALGVALFLLGYLSK